MFFRNEGFSLALQRPARLFALILLASCLFAQQTPDSWSVGTPTPTSLVSTTKTLAIGGFDSTRASTDGIASNKNLQQAVLARFPGATFAAAAALTPAFLATINALIINSVKSAASAVSPLTAAEQTALLNFVKSGGIALVLTDNSTFDPNAPAVNNSFVSPFGLSVTGTLSAGQSSTIVNSANPVVTGPAGIAKGFDTEFPGWFSSTGNAIVLAKLTANGQPDLAYLPAGALGPGSGTVVFFADSNNLAGLQGYPAASNDGTLVLNALSLYALAPPPAITPGGVVSAGAFGDFASAAPGSWIEIYGANLASTTRSWAGSDFNGVNAPTTLSGTTVSIGGINAFIDYVSPAQVNAQVPSNIIPGPQQMTVMTSEGTSANYAITVSPTEPGLLAPSSFIVGGKQYLVAIFTDGLTYVLPPGTIAGVSSQRAKPGDTIVLYGVGFGPVTPTILAGQIVGQSNMLATQVLFSLGGVPATTSYAGLAPGYVGLYQFNVTVPNVAASDLVPVTFTLGGLSGTQTLYLAMGN